MKYATEKAIYIKINILLEDVKAVQDERYTIRNSGISVYEKISQKLTVNGTATVFHEKSKPM